MEEKKETQIENVGRRKAVKTIVGGVTALAAYNVLPVKWGTPIIEQVFLPAHAATSGACSADVSGSLEITGGNTIALTVASQQGGSFGFFLVREKDGNSFSTSSGQNLVTLAPGGVPQIFSYNSLQPGSYFAFFQEEGIFENHNCDSTTTPSVTI